MSKMKPEFLEIIRDHFKDKSKEEILDVFEKYCTMETLVYCSTMDTTSNNQRDVKGNLHNWGYKVLNANLSRHIRKLRRKGLIGQDQYNRVGRRFANEENS